MSVPTSITRAGVLTALAAAALLTVPGTAAAVPGIDWDILPSGSVEVGPPTGSGAGSADWDLGSSTGSADWDLGSSRWTAPPLIGSSSGSGSPGSAG